MPAYATSYFPMPWLGCAADATDGLTYPLVSPPLGAVGNLASTSHSFDGLFAGGGPGGAQDTCLRNLAAALETSPSACATAVGESAKLAERLLGRPLGVAAAPEAPAPLQFQAGRVGLPIGFRWEGEENASNNLSTEDAASGIGARSTGAGARGRVASDTLASGPLQPQVRSGSSSRSPRSCTFAVPDDLFEEPRLDLSDPWSGPAGIWQAAQRLADTSSAVTRRCPSDVVGLADLDEALRLGVAAEHLSAEAQHEESEDAAISQALEREQANRKAAETVLAQTLRRLQELDREAVVTMSSPGVVAASTMISSAPAGPVSVPPGSGASTFAAPIRSKQSSVLVSQDLAAQVSTAVTKSLNAVPLPAPAGSASSGSQSSADTIAGHLLPRNGCANAVASATTPPPTEVRPSGGGCARSDYSTKALRKLDDAEAEVKALKANPAEKMFRNIVKRNVGTKVAQISANAKRIRDCTSGLCSYVSQTLQDPDTTKCRFVELAVAYRLADECEVAIKNQTTGRAAWPVAYVAVQVFAKFTGIEELFCGYMHRACPYLAPDYAGSPPGRQAPCPGQRPEEPFGEYVDRMIGYQRLWLAVHVAQDDLGAVWLWFARTLNTAPSPIAVSLLLSALEVAASAAQARYRRQFLKLVAYIDMEYMALIETLTQKVVGAAADRLRVSQSRLRLWLDSFRLSGQAPPPEGQSIVVAEEAELNPDI